MNLLPPHYIEGLEQNQQIASCCRHPENHAIEAYFSTAEDKAKGVPDIYVMYCDCGRMHARFCAGGGEEQPPPMPFESAQEYAARLKKAKRPFWEVR
jgi:hypothetical protein